MARSVIARYAVKSAGEGKIDDRFVAVSRIVFHNIYFFHTDIIYKVSDIDIKIFVKHMPDCSGGIIKPLRYLFQR